MKALSLTEPWATLVAIGAKKIETRSWSTVFPRRQFAIHAAKTFPGWAKETMLGSFFQQALAPYGIRTAKDVKHLGSIIAVADLAACFSTNGESFRFSDRVFVKPFPGGPEFAFGDYSPNRYMFFLENVKPLKKPIPCRGALGFWEVPEDIERQILEQVG